MAKVAVFEHRFSPRAEMVPTARHAVGQWLANSMIDDGDITYDVLLVVSELIANAVLHGDGDDVTLRLETIPDGTSLSVEVISYAAGRALPAARGGDSADYGRGLQIVNQLCEHWVTSLGPRRVDNCRIQL